MILRGLQSYRFANRWCAAAIALAIVGCGKDERDPQVQYGDPIPARLLFSDMPWYDFGDRAVASTFERIIQVANTGELSATQMRGSFYISVHFAFKGGAYPGTGGTCPETLAAGETCDLVVTFTPQYVGQFEQPVSILFFDGVTNQKATGPYLRGRGL